MQYYKDQSSRVFAFDDGFDDIPPGLEAIEESQIQQILQLQVTITEAKSKKLFEIERDRDAQAIASVTVHGRTWQADERSQRLLAGAIQMHSLTGYLPGSWRDEDNDNMTLTDVGQLVMIAVEIAQQTDAAYARSWQRKAAVAVAQTVEEVQYV